MANIEPIRVEIEREEEGRSLASVPVLPGVMAYGATKDEAVRRVNAVTLGANEGGSQSESPGRSGSNRTQAPPVRTRASAPSIR